MNFNGIPYMLHGVLRRNFVYPHAKNSVLSSCTGEVLLFCSAQVEAWLEPGQVSAVA